MKSAQTLKALFGKLSLNESEDNLSLGLQLINDAQRRLLEKYFFNESSTAIPTISQKQFYPLPYNYSKLKTGTITVGVLKWTPTEILTRREWDQLNVFPYYSDIPNNFFIYNNKLGIYPIPSTTGHTITFNYKIRVPDLSYDDYTTGSITANSASPTLIGDGTEWLANYLPASLTALTNATVATSVQLPAYTYDNGTAGVGATITGTTASTLAVDGQDLVLNDVVLVKDEVGDNSPYNGLYTVTTEGTGSVPYVLTRSTDNDESTKFVGKKVFVTGGLSNINATYMYTNTTAPTIGTTDITTKLANSVMGTNLWIKITAPKGDDEWYQISSIESATSLTLVNNYEGISTTSASYTIGQMPLLLEDYHDVLVFDALVTYFSTIVDNPTKHTEFVNRREDIILMMDEYVGTKSLNVNLARPSIGRNPNIYPQDIGN